MITKKEQEANELKHFNKAAGKLSAVALSAGALALSCPTYAFASQEGGIEAILPEMSEFIPMLVAFIILWIVLAEFGWPVFDKMLEKRANTIRDDLKNAEEARQESERVLAEYQQQLAEAKVQASKIVADAKKAGEDVKADITAKAQAEAAGIEPDVRMNPILLKPTSDVGSQRRRPLSPTFRVLSPTSRLTSRPSSSVTT